MTIQEKFKNLFTTNVKENIMLMLIHAAHWHAVALTHAHILDEKPKLYPRYDLLEFGWYIGYGVVFFHVAVQWDREEAREALPLDLTGWKEDLSCKVWGRDSIASQRREFGLSYILDIINMVEKQTATYLFGISQKNTLCICEGCASFHICTRRHGKWLCASCNEALLPPVESTVCDTVYFLMSSLSENMVKIGVSCTPKDRIKSFALPESRIIAQEAGGRIRERELHHQFSHLREGNSEWFRLDRELRAYIDSLNCIHKININEYQQFPLWAE